MTKLKLKLKLKLITLSCFLCTAISASQVDAFSTVVTGRIIHESELSINSQADFCTINPFTTGNHPIDVSSPNELSHNGKSYALVSSKTIYFNCTTTNMVISSDFPDDGIFDLANGIEMHTLAGCVMCLTGQPYIVTEPFTASATKSLPNYSGNHSVVVYIYARHTSGDYNNLPDSFTDTFTIIFTAS